MKRLYTQLSRCSSRKFGGSYSFSKKQAHKLPRGVPRASFTTFKIEHKSTVWVQKQKNPSTTNKIILNLHSTRRSFSIQSFIVRENVKTEDFTPVPEPSTLHSPTNGNLTTTTSISPLDDVTLAALMGNDPSQLPLSVVYSPWEKLVTHDFSWYEITVLLAQILLEQVHNFTGSSWSTTIIIATLLVRLFLLPLSIKQQLVSAKLTMLGPQITQLRERHQRDYGHMGSAYLINKLREDSGAIYKKHGISSPLVSLKYALIQLPVFISFFFAVRKYALNDPSFMNGGLLWFPDLAAADPYHILPLFTSLSFLAIGELNAKMQPVKRPILLWFFRGFSAISFLALFNFSAGVHLYWIINNLCSLTLVALFMLRPVRIALGIPPLHWQDSIKPVLLNTRPPKK
eukprot:TRINITY_DN16793_c0_g1_i1.p1 TRINITY_DN16793_c0_g1~~TRINITY_DN16793_c0_g1_i1.p1  ORF type:complete len:414 (-),score=37.54 TRINITY_DN16793_c0_g1_i1:180-1379(-)